MTLTDYRSLGRSGLVVSPLALGTMTFGTQRWGSGKALSRAIFDSYVDAGGNFIDTANVYAGGQSEEMLGTFLKERHLRDQVVIATKAGFSEAMGYPYAGGNSRKAIYAALEKSLVRLQTDFVDLFWVHVWDMVTPAEELLQTMTSLVRAGKIRYYALSNVPAWYFSQLVTLAHARGLPAPIAMQYEYSLVRRDIENELIPMARAFGLGLTPWSPLGGGFLSGKYTTEDQAQREPLAQGLPEGAADSETETRSDGRLNGSNPFGDSKFTRRNWEILAVLRQVASELGQTPAAVALAWLDQQAAVSSVIIGVSAEEQLQQNMAALQIVFDADHLRRLQAVSKLEPSNPADLFTPEINRFVFGGCAVKS